MSVAIREGRTFSQNVRRLSGLGMESILNVVALIGSMKLIDKRAIPNIGLQNSMNTVVVLVTTLDFLLR